MEGRLQKMRCVLFETMIDRNEKMSRAVTQRGKSNRGRKTHRSQPPRVLTAVAQCCFDRWTIYCISQTNPRHIGAQRIRGSACVSASLPLPHAAPIVVLICAYPRFACLCFYTLFVRHLPSVYPSVHQAVEPNLENVKTYPYNYM